MCLINELLRIIFTLWKRKVKIGKNEKQLNYYLK